MNKTSSCVWCEECQCPVHDWETYAWHAGHGHHLTFEGEPADSDSWPATFPTDDEDVTFPADPHPAGGLDTWDF